MSGVSAFNCIALTSSAKAQLTCFRRSLAGGFSLVEIAVVLIVVSVLAGIGLSMLGALVGSSSASATAKKQEVLKLALVAYARSFRRLPCPDSDLAAPDGVENRQSTPPGTPPNVAADCDRNGGLIPFVTLGLPREAALDGYDNFFTYYVSNVVKGASEPNREWTRTSQFSGTIVRGLTPGNLGNIRANGEGGTEIASESYPETLAAVAIVSHGQNGHGARTSKGTVIAGLVAGSDEAANASGDATAVLHQRVPSSDGFDDVVMLLRPFDLLGPLISEGTIKPAAALTQFRLDGARDILASYVLANGCTMPTDWTVVVLPHEARYDGWGNHMTFTDNTSSGTVNASTVNLFTLTATLLPSGPTIGPSGSSNGIVSKVAFPAFNTACP